MKHGDASARKFRHAIRRAKSHLPADMPAGFFLTDPERTPDPLPTVRALPDGIGVIFRHFGHPGAARTAGKLAAICRQQGRVLLIGADAALARQVRADGVHWPARLAQALLACREQGFLHTMSVHSIAELRRARALGMDGILVSTVFASASPTASSPIGPARLAAFTRSASMPVYALGGVTSANVEQTARVAGFASVSGLSEVFG